MTYRVGHLFAGAGGGALDFGVSQAVARELVGNAVPPELGRVVVRSVVEALDG